MDLAGDSGLAVFASGPLFLHVFIASNHASRRGEWSKLVGFEDRQDVCLAVSALYPSSRDVTLTSVLKIFWSSGI